MIVVIRRRFVGLNGLKGIALIAIVLYHCDQGTLRGGFLGVDIFFTISGFLIFSSLLNHIDSGKGIGFKEYYLKRLHRIYPALILMIPVTVSLAWFINQDMLVDINNQIVTAMLGCYNWYAIGSGASYFSQMNPDMFRHLWFMSVLMQFYLLAPLLIYLLRKILVRWVPVAVLAGLAVCSALSMGLQYHPGTDPTRVYFGSDTHAMGLWLGAMLAWLLMIIRRGNGRPEETAIMERARLVWSKIGPAAAFVALLILLWMMQHVEQGPAAFYGGISRLRYFQWFWSPVPFLSDLGCRICWCSNHLMWPADIHTAFTCGIGLYGCSPRRCSPVGCSASGMDAANHTRSYRMLYRHVVEVGRTARRPWRIYRHDSPAARKRNVGCNQMLDYDRRGIEYMLDVWIRGSQRTKADQCGTRVGRECENAERAAGHASRLR